ncbi:MAG TPA: VCBS repeat-containing protein, partial [Polyangium sp.]|nr:VCBS repeat-containing protein [Polyangium sp.]
STAQCFSNYCADGFCCGNVCTGSCYACSNAKKGAGYDGVCAPINSGLDPDNECNPGECNGSGTCNQAQMLLANGAACASGAQCSSGNCVDGVCCDTACTGGCQACTALKKSGGTNGTCGNIAYDTDPDNECANGSCSGSGTCQFYNGVACTTTAQCLSNYCVDGFCCGNICNLSCMACSAAKKGSGYDGACGMIGNNLDPDNECNPGECNGSGICNQFATPQPNGSLCTFNSNCISGFCVDGYCCDTACTGTCMACSQAKTIWGQNGVCYPINFETDPDKECGAGKCAGGQCKYYNGPPCSSDSQCFSGYCRDGVCCGNDCNQSCSACTAAKKGSGIDGQCGSIANNTDPDNECGLSCNGSGACQPAANGASCSANAECVSGSCVDGVCCDTSCTGTCRACTAAKKGGGSNGQCGPIAVNTDPDNECPTDCNGASACIASLPNGSVCSNASQCLSGQCVNGVCCNNACTSTCKACNVAGSVGTCTERSPGACKTCSINKIGLPGPAFTQIYTSIWNDATIVDLDNDGKVELVGWQVANNIGHSFATINNVFSATQQAYTQYIAENIVAMTIADVNGDNKVDVITSHRQDVLYTGPVGVWLNNGNGTFAAPVNYLDDGVTRPATTVVQDLDNDGDRDIVVGQFYGASIKVLKNQGNGTFALDGTYASDQNLIAIAVADVSGDGHADIIGGARDSSLVQVFLGQSNGSFLAATNYTTGNSADSRKSLQLLDLNGDGKLDIGLSLVSDYANPSGTSVLVNNGNGTFGASTSYTYVSKFGDVSGDGKPDLIGVTSNSSAMSVRINQGNGIFGGNANYSTATSPRLLGTADLNGDGKLDIVTTNEGNIMTAAGGTISAWLNQGGGTFGTRVDSNAAATFIAAFIHDVNSDGAMDVGLAFNKFGPYV